MDDAPARIKSGPLSGKRVGLLAGPEFSDFQAYYLNLYLSELGARVCNLVIGWPEVGWKMTRPATSDTVQGTFGLRLDPIPTMAHGDRYTTLVFRDQSQLTAAFVGELDALIVLGGHSADVLRVDPAVTCFVADAWQRGVLVGALECGQMVLMSAGIIDGQRVTGYRVVRPFLSRLGSFVDEPVVVDGNLITGRDSDATPRFVRALARYFQPDWEDPTVDLLAGKRIVIVAGQDFEDVELCVPAMEFDQRGARVILGTFPAPVVSRPPMLGVNAVMGNFGMSVPFQELDDTRYPVVPLADLRLDDFDAVMIPGALLPLELPRRRLAGGAVPARRRGRQGGGGYLPRPAGAGRRRPGSRPPRRWLHRVPRRRDHHGRALRLRLAGDDRRQHRHRPRPR